MAYSVEKLLSDAATLVSRLKEHDSIADILISQTGNLHKRMEAMKEYQDDITELNEIAKHRPRSHLVIGIAQENRQIRELQQENRELQIALEEHQSALELIMKKYREQDMEKLINKICEMANVMQKSVHVDEDASVADREKLTQLEIENKGLRELLEICSTGRFRILGDSLDIERDHKEMQTQTGSEEGAVGDEKQETEEDEKSGERTPRNVEDSDT
ncbi:FGOP2-like protein [Mya arenaria]|uniref:FGOP2-like protein n=1 Tax=Mya arenaria TaxID=6604 RepID=A0ABY7E085_MYAAR|nr:FGOP2-like protein [Mya arenaria]